MLISITFCRRNVLAGNEQHDAEIASATGAAEDDVAKFSEDLIHHINSEYFRNLFMYINLTKSFLSNI